MNDVILVTESARVKKVIHQYYPNGVFVTEPAPTFQLLPILDRAHYILRSVAQSSRIKISDSCLLITVTTERTISSYGPRSYGSVVQIAGIRGEGVSSTCSVKPTGSLKEADKIREEQIHDAFNRALADLQRKLVPSFEVFRLFTPANEQSHKHHKAYSCFTLYSILPSAPSV